ncbi:BZIP-like protein [Rhynchospora pubera]|uniref:BZIP-like protein n=1 Tax=Rhynchospora pubera TaxID=906938 RepID=A0AAV8HKZ5_9POAL|nr:BZIP-like protein [Rhynchospora pubera]
MELNDEEFLAQFASLSSNDNEEAVEIPLDAEKERNWPTCIVARVLTHRSISHTLFSTTMRNAWAVQPDNEIEAAGSNHFIREFKCQEDMFYVLKGGWHIRGDMVVCRMARGIEDTSNPQVNEMTTWVEVHGVLPESINLDGVQLVFKKVGIPLSDIKICFYGNQKVYKQQVLVKINKSLIPKVPVNRKNKPSFWVYIVYRGVMNVCLFCGFIGHDHANCPTKMRAWRLKQEGKYNKEIPETQLGRWITDRTRVPRKNTQGTALPTSSHHSAGANSGSQNQRDADGEGSVESSSRGIEKKLRRGVDLSTVVVQQTTLEETQKDIAAVQINCKRAREAIPNSPPRSQ